MLKKIEDLLPKLNDLSAEMDLVKDNLLALEEAYSNGVNNVPNNAMTIPCMLLQEKCQKLDALNDAFHEAMREVRHNV